MVLVPWRRHDSLISGRDRILLISRLSVSTIARGVPAGALTPIQVVWLDAGIPASAMGGPIGRTGERTMPEVPSAFTRPSSMVGAIVGTLSNIRSIWPDKMSARAPVEPL